MSQHNYNADAEVDDASCTYPAEGLDCDGNCIRRCSNSWWWFMDFRDRLGNFSL